MRPCFRKYSESSKDLILLTDMSIFFQVPIKYSMDGGYIGQDYDMRLRPDQREDGYSYPIWCMCIILHK